jgi:hypothetical protein
MSRFRLHQARILAFGPTPSIGTLICSHWHVHSIPAGGIRRRKNNGRRFGPPFQVHNSTNPSARSKADVMRWLSIGILPTYICRFLASVPILVAGQFSLRHAGWQQFGSLHRAVNVIRKSCLHWTGWECYAQPIYPVMPGRHAGQ